MARDTRAHRNRKHREKTESPPSIKKARKKTTKRPIVIEPKTVQRPSKATLPTKACRRSSPKIVEEELPRREHMTKLGDSITGQNSSIEKIPKSKTTVSVAGIFKKGQVEVKKQRQHRNSSPEKLAESELSSDFHVYLEEARTAIDVNMQKSFNDAHEELTSKLASSRRSSKRFFGQLLETTRSLAFPIAEEQITSTFKRDGVQVTETVNMGQRIAEFKKIVENERGRLEDQWQQWEDLQNEYIELGLDVFGAEAFVDVPEGEEERGSGFKWEMELANLEHGARVEEITAEVEELKTEGLKMMMKTEKEMTASSNEETARILKAIIGG